MRPRPPTSRSRLLRALSVVLALVVLLVAAPPAGAAPLTVSHPFGPQRSALSTALLLQDDFDLPRNLGGAAPQAPAGLTWASTAGSWTASGGSATPSSAVSALTVEGGVPGADVTGVLASPNQVFGLLTVGGTVRWGVAAQAGSAGRLEGGLRCVSVLTVGVSSCALVLWSVVNGSANELCTVSSYPAASTTSPRVRLRTSGASATLSVVGSSGSCTAVVPVELRAQTRVGVSVAASVALNLLGSASIVQQVTAVRTDWTVPPTAAGA